MSVKPKRILFIDSGNGIGGSSKYLIALFTYLDKSRFEPVLACYRKGLNFEAIKKLGVRTYNLNVPRMKTDTSSKLLGYWEFLMYFLFAVIPLTVRLVSLIRREKIDLLHLNNEILTHLAGIIAGKLTSRKIVCYFQGYRKLTTIEKYFGRYVDGFMALSVAGAELFEKQLNHHVEPVHLAVDLAHYEFPAVDMAIMKKQYPGKKLVGVSGRIMSWKGQDIFIEAAEKILKSYREIKFIIVGDEAEEGKPFTKKLAEMVKHLGIEDDVIFLGWRRDVPQILSELDIVVHASKEPEPFGLVIIEAMAMAKPVIATNAGGVPEILGGDNQTQDSSLKPKDENHDTEKRRNGETARLSDSNGFGRRDAVSPIRQFIIYNTGILVPPGDAAAMADAILKLLQDDALALAMGKAGRRRVEQCFDIKQNAEKIQKIYEQLIDERQDYRPKTKD